jgi:hypothetical protein
VAGGGEGGVADLAVDAVEAAEGFIDALLGRLGGQAWGGLQADPHTEKAGDDGVEQFPAALLVLCCARSPGQAGEVRQPPGRGEVADDGEGEVAGRGRDRGKADLGREVVPSLRNPASRVPAAIGRALGACA